jgi:phosphohistidine phosphatase
VREALYLAEPDQILDTLLEVPDDRKRVLLVGHNPGMSELVAVMTREFCSMPTAAVAEILMAAPSLSAVASSPQGRLVELHQPTVSSRDSSRP